MSIVWMEPFTFYGTSEANMLAGGVWSNVDGTLSNDPDGVSTGFVLKVIGGDSGQVTQLVIPTAGDVHNIGFRWWLSQLPNSTAHSPSLVLKSSGNSSKYQLRSSPTGQLVLIRSTDSTTIATSAAGVVMAGAWRHVEWMMNRTSGAYEVRVEGVQVLSGTDGSPATGDSAILEFKSSSGGAGASNTTPYIKDLFIADDAGSQNNAFIGPVTLYTLPVSADVSNGWSLSTGTTAYSLLDELTPNDADYIQADDTLPAACIMEYTDLPADVVAVRACMPVVRIEKTDGGDSTVQLGLVSSGDVDTGASHAPGTSFSYIWDISELDPHTSTLWSPVTVDAAQLKIDRTL